jgi:large subunit ribosomal protein L7/L12
MKNVEVPEKFKAIVSAIEVMSVMDLAELVKLLEDKFNVSAAAPVMMAAASGAAAEEEKSIFDLELTATGDNKIAVIKVIREMTQLGLKESKDIVDAAPKIVREGIAKADAEAWKKKLEDAGAKAALK